MRTKTISMYFRLPELLRLYPPFLHPEVDQADMEVIRWVERLRLAPSPGWSEYYRKARFTWFSARCFPEASLPLLCLAAQFNVWLFLLDDSCDGVITGNKYGYIRDLAEDLQVVLSGFEPGPDNETGVLPLVSALRDIWWRLRSHVQEGWTERFTRSMIRYLDACKQEAMHVDQDIWPTLEQYTRYRPYLGAVHLEPDLAEVVHEILLPVEIREHPHIQSLQLLCARIVCWSNDLFSLRKEMENGDKHNLVLIIRHEYGCGLPEAVREAAFIHDKDLRKFQELCESLPDFAGRDGFAARRYVEGLKYIISANMEWSITDSKRYRFTFEHGGLSSRG